MTMQQPQSPVNIPSPTLPSLDWSPDARANSLDALYTYVENQIYDALRWYYTKKASQSRWSKGLRVAAICLTTFGGVSPLVATAFPASAAQLSAAIDHLGYVLLALAGGAVALDRFFGYSSSWMRYVATCNRLNRLLVSVQLEWATTKATFTEKELTVEVVRSVIGEFAKHAEELGNIIERESQTWAQGLSKALAEYEQSIRETAPHRQTNTRQ